MAINTETIMPIGMNKDSLIGTGNSDKYAFENLNLRYIASEDGTTGSWTTEKSTKQERALSMSTNILGQAVINNTLILFIHLSEDYIVKVYYEDDELKVDTLYTGNLNFSSDHKIETTVSYESEYIQKVYWVDGINPLRMINIAKVKASSNFDNQFDTIPKLSLNEQVTIDKKYEGAGMFPSGTTQYFFTYVDKYGRESNIFYSSSLYYNSLKDRGINPDGSEYASCSYSISITNLDIANQFDYLRIYSVIRPVEGAVPVARIVTDIDITDVDDENNSVEFIDTNTTGEIIDYTTILFLGSKPVIPSTLEQKNNTLFLGNIKLGKYYTITPKFKKAVKDASTLTFEQVAKIDPDNDFTVEKYPFNKSLNLNADNITTFKKGITYRFALQFQDFYGNWTDAIYLGDVLNTESNTESYKIRANAEINFSTLYSQYNNILSNFKKIRLLCTYPTFADKEIVAQGVLCPTMYHPAWGHSPDRFSSWFFRPEKGNAPLSVPEVHPREAKELIVVKGNYSTKLKVNNTRANWNAYSEHPENLLKADIYNRDVDRVFSVQYSSGIESYKEYVDDASHSVPSSYPYVQATISVTDLNTSTIIPIYFIRLYQHNPQALYFRPYYDQTQSTYTCYISNDSNTESSTTADTTRYMDDGSSPETLSHNSWRILYTADNPYINISDDVEYEGEGTDTYYGKKVSYNYMVTHVYDIDTTRRPSDIMQFYDYKETVVEPTIDSIIAGFNRESYYYYSGDVKGGYGWDAKGRVTEEVQSADSPVSSDYTTSDSLDKWGFYIDNKEYFTLHSPDVEYNETLQTTNIQDYKLRIIGQVNQTAWDTDIEVDADSYVDGLGNKGTGIFKTPLDNSYHYTGIGAEVKDVNVHPAYWRDLDVYAANIVDSSESKLQIRWYQYDYLIYPYHRKYINNYVRDVEIQDYDSERSITRSGVINYKRLSVYRVFGNTNLYSDSNSVETENSVSANFYIDNSYTPIKVRTNSTTINYSGTVDDLAEPCTKQESEAFIHKYDGLFTRLVVSPDIPMDETACGVNQTQKIISNWKGSYPIRATKYKRYTPENSGYYGNNADDVKAFLSVDSESPQIRFKSNTHAVLNLKELTDSDKWPVRQVMHPSLYLAELVKNVSNRYGGNSITALKNNIYYPCGEPVILSPTSLNPDGNINIYGTRGDCYFMAYDCLKTYPYSNDERNGVVEIAAFNCESYINLNGRYDKYNGQMNVTDHLDKTKFGLINIGYTQNKDLFSYHIVDDDINNYNNFPNQITWTKTKVYGEIVDTWTNITLANVANAEGTMGAITALSIYNDNLILFQEHGIARIGYNEKTAISTENGVPLEIASSNKFTGFSYLSKEIGCQNKWTINISKNGLMFIDTSRKELNIVGDSIIALSTKHGFDSFFIKELEADSNFTTYYDKISKDIYYLNSRCCLAFNEVSSTFTSFYSYEGITSLAVINNHAIASKNGYIWALREGDDYSNYFGETKPYKMIVCCDGNSYFQTDKVFNTVETRSDIFNPDSIDSTVDENPFDTIAAWNSYQKPADFNLDGSDALYEWPASRRYNIWRYVIPRATYDDGEITSDRIRNPFAFIKLERKLPSGNRAIIHDMVIYYDIR